MPVNINEAIQKIKRAGAANVRTVPMDGQSVNDGNYQIDIRNNGGWDTILVGVKKQMAEDIIRQATNKVLLG